MEGTGRSYTRPETKMNNFLHYTKSRRGLGGGGSEETIEKGELLNEITNFG